MGTLQEEIEQFTEHMARRGSCENTLAAYRRDLHKLAAYFDAQKACGSRITEQQLRNYVHHLEQEGKRPATIARAIASVKAFFRYLLQEGVVATNPAARLKAPKTEKRIPHILTPEEVVRLLQQPDGKSAKSIRDRAMLELLYATGIRVSELIQLRLEDVSLDMEYILCRQGGRERVIPFGRTAKGSIREYLERARPALVTDPGCELLFTNLSGQQMSRQGFWKLLKQYGRAAGIQGEITPHTLRHSFAAHLVNNGADLYVVQEMMGYTGLAATQVYAQMRNASIREVYTNTHPRE